MKRHVVSRACPRVRQRSCVFPASKQGFTLMEVAMAIIVMAIGVTAAFSLVTSGLKSSSKAQEDTAAQMFADNVFNGLRALNLEAAAQCQQDPSAWSSFWDGFSRAQTPLPLAPEEAWRDSEFSEKLNSQSPWNPDTAAQTEDGQGIRGVPSAGRAAEQIRRIEFKNGDFGGHPRGNKELSNHAIRYRLRIEPQTDPDRVRTTLFVWPGKFGPDEDGDALVFYSEFNNPGYL